MFTSLDRLIGTYCLKWNYRGSNAHIFDESVDVVQ